MLFDFSSAIDPSGFLMFIGDGPDYGVADEAIVASADGALFDYWDLGIFESVTGSGLHKEAITLARNVGGGDYEYAWCDDGNTATTQTVNYLTHLATVDTILFGHDGVDRETRSTTSTSVQSRSTRQSCRPICRR
ncbi:hypothetical protein AJ88_33135 [Mesorhizobium amorphae CCBAU 01583]|nr:hypothetical protein AJ88_33135 [Mesorhizobium amorphae CCBAU 01583]